MDITEILTSCFSKHTYAWPFLSALMIPVSVAAQTFTGKPVLPEVVELFTSEGCSSCPPADKFISSFKNHNDLFDTVFPMAFHVDYWDYIGWKDPFAKPEFSQRQRRMASAGRVSQVYTPGFVANGREWRRWFSGEREWPINRANGETDWYLQTEIRGGQGAASILGWRPDLTHSLKDGQFHMALLGMGLISKVSRGENKGRTLTHDFVVLEYQTAPVNEHWSTSWKANGQALVVWLTNSNGEPLRAVGGLITESAADQN